MGHIHEKIDFTVGVFIVNKSKVLLVDHLKLRTWLPVGGHIEPDEDPEQALFREIEEECGLKVRILATKPEINQEGCKPLLTPAFLDIHKINDIHRHVGLVYFGISEDDNVNLAPSEHKELRWFIKEELLDKKYKILESVKFYSLEALKAATEK